MSRLRRQEVDVLQLELLHSGHSSLQDAASPSTADVKSAMMSTAAPAVDPQEEPVDVALLDGAAAHLQFAAAPALPLLRSLASQLLDAPHAPAVTDAAMSARLLLAAGRGSSQTMPRAPKSRWRGCAREPGALHGLSRYIRDACETATRLVYSYNIIG